MLSLHFRSTRPGGPLVPRPKNQQVNELSAGSEAGTELLCQPKSNGYQARIDVVHLLLSLVPPQLYIQNEGIGTMSIAATDDTVAL